MLSSWGNFRGAGQGVRNAIGNDGLWTSPENHTLLIEVKTTDTYSISVDTIATYRDSLLANSSIVGSNSMLLVVGRYDTGQLEAQVRGSRHAWDMRLISVDSLINLVRLKENTEDVQTSEKIRSVLVPLEYTRLDRLVDVMFTAAHDVETVLENENPTESKVAESGQRSGNWEFTDRDVVDSMRAQILRKIERTHDIKLIKKSRALYSTTDRRVGVACTISKYYPDSSVKYWYAHHTPWQDFLEKAEQGFLALGCINSTSAFLIPSEVMSENLQYFNTTNRNGKTYWHIHIQEKPEGGYRMLTPGADKHMNLDEFVLHLED